jgi:GntR family carbon starvation induced transcriptional regulator
MTDAKQTDLPAAAGETLASAIYGQIRAEILSGVLVPGTKINLRAMCERFDVGFSPVREALNRLVSQQLVGQSDRRGFRVTPVSAAELADVTRARCLVNAAALRASIAEGDAAWEETILLAFHRLLRTPRDDATAGLSRWTGAHKHFHASLLSACGSRWLLQYCDQLFEAAERYRLLGASAAARQGDADEEHRAIMQATIDRRADEAVLLLDRHFQKTMDHLKGLLPLQGAGLIYR